MPNYYEILKVQPNATTPEIEAACDTQYHYWRRLVTHHDPEMVSKANQALQWLEKIRATLTDPVKRKAYDTQLRLNSSPATNPQPVVVQSASDNAIVCPKCHVANSKSARFCVRCGETLIVDCPRCNTQMIFSEKFCPKCGGNHEELKYQLELEETERRHREQEEARFWEEERQRREIHRKQVESFRSGLSILGGILGAITAPLFWAAVWPDVMGTPVGIIAQIIMGAIAGSRSNRRLVEKVEKWNPIIAYGIGFFAGILAGVGSFPVIALNILRLFFQAK